MERIQRQLELPDGTPLFYEISKDTVKLEIEHVTARYAPRYNHYYELYYDDLLLGHVQKSFMSNGYKYNPFHITQMERGTYSSLLTRKNFQNLKTACEYLVLANLAMS